MFFPHLSSGRLINYDGNPDYMNHQESLGVSHHYTLVFNTFIIIQIFNLLNCFFYGNEFNFSIQFIKRKFSDNYTFLFIFSGLIATQVIIIEFAGDFFKVSRDGLTFWEWIASFAFGVGCLILDVIIRFISTSFVEAFKLNILFQKLELTKKQQQDINEERLLRIQAKREKEKDDNFRANQVVPQTDKNDEEEYVDLEGDEGHQGEDIFSQTINGSQTNNGAEEEEQLNYRGNEGNQNPPSLTHNQNSIIEYQSSDEYQSDTEQESRIANQKDDHEKEPLAVAQRQPNPLKNIQQSIIEEMESQHSSED
eukprot:403371404